MSEPENLGSFVARFWLEQSSDHVPTWRGHLRRVQGKEECYFQTLAEMKDFLERISGVPISLKNEFDAEEKDTTNRTEMKGT